VHWDSAHETLETFIQAALDTENSLIIIG